MKTFVFENNYTPATPGLPSSWHFLADSCLSNAGKPFFIPDFADKFVAAPVFAVRINRLGKSIAPRFAERYYSDAIPAIHFFAPDLARQLMMSSLSADKARSFDRSLIMSDCHDYSLLHGAGLQLANNGTVVAELTASGMIMTINEVIAAVSDANTMKMGDLIIPATPPGIDIRIGDFLELKVNEKCVLSVQIK